MNFKPQSSEYFVKGALMFSLTTMLLMTSMIAVFISPEDSSYGYESEMDELLSQYSSMTGEDVRNEQIWGLTGIYTPYGIDRDGKDSTAYMTLLDGWVAGDRIESYTPSQFKEETDFNDGRCEYTVKYDSDKGLYYYTNHGEDLLDIKDGEQPIYYPDSEEIQGYTPISDGTLYTSVAMDTQQKSKQFFTVGTKTQMDNGTFYYNYTGYRYCFQALKDYYYTESTPITHTNTSLSLIWYQYTVDSGISGQLVLSGSDSGVSYITAAQIVQSFNSANATSKFVMKFNGIEMNIYIHLNIYAINHGFTVEECYNQGYWDVLVTSPAMTPTESSDTTLETFSAEKLLGIVTGLLTFHGEDYGLTGIAGTIASTIFSLSMYASLIAIGMTFTPVLILAGILAVIQSFGIADLWPW